jgi:chemotaxis response regulator CheB
MPRAIVDHGLADAILPLHRIANAIAQDAGR